MKFMFNDFLQHWKQKNPSTLTDPVVRKVTRWEITKLSAYRMTKMMLCESWYRAVRVRAQLLTAGDHPAVGGMRREAGNGHVSFSQGTDSPSEYLTYPLKKEDTDSGTLKWSKATDRTIGKPGAAGLTERHRGWTCSSDDQSALTAGQGEISGYTSH